MRRLLLLMFPFGVLAAPLADFSRDIRPLLSDRCFTCHGPDEKTRMAGLRLDLEAEAKKPRGNKSPIIPGNAAASELFRRITHSNAALRMPPQHASPKPLTPRDIELIKNWIDQGAKWQSHWAFTAPQRPPLPTVKNTGWVRNGIDRFVLARLEKENLKPSPELDKERLLRRVSFDLTGLPPSAAELDAFLKDAAPEAYERAVDRLLASPRYGERMAVDWLDAARYADTHGYQVDPQKEMWAWRDWVVNAFNRNLPFDRFTIEQIAGDLLPNPTLEQRVATGFNRNHRVNTEAGSIAQEFHVENVIDRVSTTGTVWLGLTVGCARCHDHKYDPISAKDFYSLFAFFNNVPEVGTGGPRDGRGNLNPVMKLPAPELEAKAAALAAKIRAARDEQKELEAKLAGGQQAWEKQPATPEWQVLTPANLVSENGATLTVLPDGSVLSSGKRPDKDIYSFTIETMLQNITAFRLELLPDPSLPGGGSGRGDGGRTLVTLFEAKLSPLDRPKSMKPVELAKISSSFSSPESLIDKVLRPMIQLARGWSVDPEVTKPHYAVIEPRTMIGYVPGTRFHIRLGSQFGEGRLIGRFRIAVTNSEFPEPIPADIRKALDSSDRDAKQQTALRRYYTSHLRPYREIADHVARLDTEKRNTENRIPSTMVMSELEAQRDAFVLGRGQYDKPGDKVTAAIPAFLPPLPAGAPSNRLGFAEWLVSRENPLTSRVIVNRFWQAAFGTGLVKTSEDFGSQGEPPTHPELLDYLATQFIDSGWDIKALQKQILMSATYRQSSKVTPQLKERDPENRLLARGPRFRLPAEMIRDQALLLAGLLAEKRGGPPVKPYQPDGLWEQLSVIDDKKLYDRSTGADLYRRSLYTYWKRTVPPPSLATFDAPTREFCVVRRPMSSTPLQALALLNDETYVEAARKLAERMLSEAGSQPAARLTHAFRLATSRQPTVAEINVLTAGLEKRLTQYRAQPKDAAQLLTAGEAKSNPALDPVELAAYTTVASVILNLDEVVTKQ